MNEEQKIPDHLRQNSKNPNRYDCLKCGHSTSKLFADLGCSECNGEGLSKDYPDAKRCVDDAIWWLTAADRSLTNNEKEKLKEQLKDDLNL